MIATGERRERSGWKQPPAIVTSSKRGRHLGRRTTSNAGEARGRESPACRGACSSVASIGSAREEPQRGSDAASGQSVIQADRQREDEEPHVDRQVRSDNGAGLGREMMDQQPAAPRGQRDPRAPGGSSREYRAFGRAADRTKAPARTHRAHAGRLSSCVRPGGCAPPSRFATFRAGE